MGRTARLIGIASGTLLALGGVAAVVITRTDAGYRWYLDRMYAGNFPDVNVVMPEQLASEVNAAERPVLLDVRAPEEYAVSHLQGARLADPGAFNPEMLADVGRDRPIVVYCSVGYRSARMAQRLHSLGYTNVRNLYGGIFLWYNQGRAVVGGAGGAERSVERIHPYSFMWGQFITRDGKTYEP
ncbi:MAG: rhodanese-like domain-containing protein [Bacteroidetes bacterium]|nr:rhodanese-like domain-containing protein [Bacteroidota bacterium]